MATFYLLHTVDAKPREWRAVSAALVRSAPDALGPAGGNLFGIWRSQIGRPRDEVTVITFWPDETSREDALTKSASWLDGEAAIVSHQTRSMRPTLRPEQPLPPTRQGNFAFRYFVTPTQHFEEFLSLCAAAWPGFEASYDSQVVGLWQFERREDGADIETLLLTRRPDLAMWERSKLPQGAAEAEVRAKLSRRYDLCEATWVNTTTLLTASDRTDDARWA